MRYETSVTSISWIPSEAIQGMTKLPFDVGFAHYDQPPPDTIDDLEALRAADRFRFANVLSAWVEVDDNGRITSYGQDGGGRIGVTKIRLGRAGMTVQAVAFPDRRAEPEVGDDWVRFRQTAGGRTGMPAPRRVNHPPFVQIQAPTAWTTLEVTLHADGRSERKLVGASPFPRHWVYDDKASLSAKSGTIEFATWQREAFGVHTPWGDQDSPALVTEIETALERQLSVSIMQPAAKPRMRRVAKGETLVEQGDPGDELFLLLDGVLAVVQDGEPKAEVGPGAVLGEMALLEGGRRTATLRAMTACRVAAVNGDEIDPQALAELRDSRRPNDG
ncbi:MAG: cyclic nucleotide-binding domain-containing protein [Actinomycetota bacterium]|jgi:hypothetical protein|nr:cyclic nucleotide-binding domain-containing protein [Actinomycetota bacterium]